MTCIACNGTGDGIKHGEAACIVCEGTGHICDKCGEFCEEGMDICSDCDQTVSDPFPVEGDNNDGGHVRPTVGRA